MADSTSDSASTCSAGSIPAERRHAWQTVIGAMVGFMFSYATLGVMTLSLLTDSLTESFGWRRAQISLGLFIFVAAAVSVSWPLGALMDRDGVRRWLLPSLAMFGLILYSMSHFTAHVFHFYAAYLLLGLFAAATLPNSYTRVVVEWFDERRGLALGIAASGAAIGMVALPPLFTAVLIRYGFEQVYVTSALAVLVICLPSAFLLLKERHSAHSKRAFSTSTALPLSHLLRSKPFVVLSAAFCLLGYGTIGLIPHLMPLMQDYGATPMAAAQVMSVYGLAAVVGRVVCGYLLDRIFAPHVMVASAVAPAVACLLLVTSPTYSSGLIAAGLVGFAAGAELDLMAYMISRYMGLALFAQIYGLMFGAFYVAGAAGSAVLGWQFDLYGDYTFGLLVASVPLLAAAVIATRLGAYPSSASVRPVPVN